MQALGRSRAWVWLMAMPILEAPPLRTAHRHWGSDCTTLLNWVQQEEEGLEAFPVMKSKHGDKLTMAVVHLLVLGAEAPIQVATNTTVAKTIRVSIDDLNMVVVILCVASF